MYIHAQIIQNVGHALCLKCQSLEMTKLVQAGKSPCWDVHQRMKEMLDIETVTSRSEEEQGHQLSWNVAHQQVWSQKLP